MKFLTLVIMITMAATACQKQSTTEFENRIAERTTLQMESISAVKTVSTSEADKTKIPSPTDLVEKDLLTSFQKELKAEAKLWSQEGFKNLLNTKIADDDDTQRCGKRHREALKVQEILAANSKNYEMM